MHQGLGCGEGSGGSCTESGDGVRIKTGKSEDSGFGNLFSQNILHTIAYNGVDVFGHTNTLRANVIEQACFTKGDCGGIRTYGSGSLATSSVYDLTLDHNCIIDTIGNTDGALSTYDPLFGMGLYIDHYSRDVIATNNTIINATFHGILYQNSSGSIRDNVLYNNATGTMYASQVYLSGSETLVSRLEGNVLYGLQRNSWSLGMNTQSLLAASENNFFFNPYQDNHIYAATAMSFAQWQNLSGMDAQSVTNWFTLSSDQPARSVVVTNTTKTNQTAALGLRNYLDLKQNQVSPPYMLAPFSSAVLIDNGGRRSLEPILFLLK